MSFLDRIREANSGHRAAFSPLRVAGQDIGRVRHDLVERLLGYSDVFCRQGDALTLSPALDNDQVTIEQRTDAFASVTSDLRQLGIISGWRDEAFAIRRRYQDPALLYLERAALPLFGIRGWGLHINGYVNRSDGQYMWIAQRSRSKPTWPGMLDQIVAGGQPAELDISSNVIKECHEEAGMSAELARRAVPTGAISYCLDSPAGLRPDVALTFDLALPHDFTPRNQDGEVETFHLWPVTEVANRVRNTTDFKFNCALVIIDFLLRHGHIRPEEPDYLELVTGLRAMPVAI